MSDPEITQLDKKWYAVIAYSGMEKKVQKALQENIIRHKMEALFGEIFVPTEEVVEMKKGEKKVTQRKILPGYVFVQMEMNDETWHLVKETSKVTGFIGAGGKKPSPISEKEIQKIRTQIKDGAEKPKHKISFEIGEVLRVKDGPFTDFNCSVEEVSYEKSRLRVSVAIFGRETPVELDFGQVEKI